MKRIPLLIAALFLAFFGGAGGMTDDTPGVRVTKLDAHLYKLLVNDFVNLVAYIGEEGTLLVDSGFKETALSVMGELRKLGSGRIKYLINTHADLDHYGGNSRLGEDALIIAHQNFRALLESQGDFPKDGLPHLVFSDKMALRFDSEIIEISSIAGCHSGEDIMVHFTDSDVVCLGDIINPGSFPVMWIDRGASIRAFIANLERLMTTLPSSARFVVGHGRDLKMKELQDYRDMLVETMEIVLNALKKGKSVEEMKKDKILKAYKNWDDTETDWINTDYWIKTLVKSIKKDAMKRMSHD